MVRRLLSLSAALVLCISLLSGCGASTSQNASAFTAASADMKEADAAKGSGGNGGMNKESKEQVSGAPVSDAKTVQTNEKPAPGKTEFSSSIVGTGTVNQATANAILEQRKIIRNANVTVEVDDFDVAYGKIQSLIGGFGFIQETNIKKDKVYVDSQERLITKGIIVIRVDKNKFESILLGIKGLGLLTEQTIKTDDVTDQYFDSESRLRLLKYEETRLEDYLKKISDPDTIFKTEDQLTNIRHEIERLTVTLKRWSDLADLSTITINISEKIPGPAVQPTKDVTYWDRLGNSFLGSTKGVVLFCGNLLIFIVEALPVLVLLALIGFVGFRIYRRYKKKTVSDAASEKNDQNISM